MELINIPVKGKVLQLFWEYKDGVYSLQNDVVNGDWTVGNIIKLGGPKSSIYKYDFRNYFEFVVTDVNNKSRVLTWYYNGEDEVLEAGINRDRAIYSLPFFFQKHPIFQCTDWEDYECKVKLIKISHIMNNDNWDNVEKVNQIVSILR